MGDYNDAFLRNNNNNGSASVQARTKAVNRANVMQLKLIGQSHPTGLTANLLKLFEPRPPLEFKTPPEKRKCLPYTGMAQFVNSFAEPSDPEYAPPVEKAETPAQRRARVQKLRLEEAAKKAAERLEKYDPNNDPNISGDPYKTLFVAGFNYETSESKIKREFEAYGPIKRVRLVADKETNKPRGYAFIEYMHTRDMKAAYKQGDGRKIDNRRVLVDVERGRTVPNWRPRRLGGGLGTSRIAIAGDEESNHREPQQTGGTSRSEEPRTRDDRDRKREKSRERVKERERELEKSHDQTRDRDRDGRHHRDRDRTRDKDRSRDRDQARSHDRNCGRDRVRDHDRDRHRDRDHDDADRDRDRGRSRDKDYDCDRVEPKRERDRHSDRGKSHNRRDEDGDDDGGWYDDQHNKRAKTENEHDDDDGGYYGGGGYYDQNQGDQDGYDDYGYDRSGRDKDLDYRRSDRSVSREYERVFFIYYVLVFILVETCDYNSECYVCLDFLPISSEYRYTFIHSVQFV